MPTNDNTNETHPKRRCTDMPSEQQTPSDQPSKTTGTSTTNVIDCLNKILETKRNKWSERQVDVFVSLTQYANGDIAETVATHLNCKQMIAKELEAAKKLDNDEFTPQHIKIDSKLKGNRALTDSKRFTPIQE